MSHNHRIELHDALQASYGNKQAREKLRNAGYEYDSMLSNHNQQVFYNPKKHKILFTIAGTHNLHDVGTDIYLALGKLKSTNRYKEARQVLDQAKQKYKGAKASIAGHSLGASVSSYLGDKYDKKYLYNAGYTIGQKTRSNGGNTLNLRTLTDPVSLLSFGSKHQKTVGLGSLNPFEAHDLDDLKNKNIYV